MDIEEDCDSYLVNTNYNYDYPLGGMSLATASNISLTTFSTDSNSNSNPPDAHKVYTSLGELESISKNKSKGEFFAVHVNAVSLVAHYDEIESLLNKVSLAERNLCSATVTLVLASVGGPS